SVRKERRVGSVGPHKGAGEAARCVVVILSSAAASGGRSYTPRQTASGQVIAGSLTFPAGYIELLFGRAPPARALHVTPCNQIQLERISIMSQASLVCPANTTLRPHPRRSPRIGVGSPNKCRSAAERLLHEAAYVCHLTRSVREAITGQHGRHAS